LPGINTLFMKKNIPHYCLSFLLFLLIPALLPAQVKKGTIRGYVKDSSNNKAIGYATAGLYRFDKQDKAVRNVFTSDKGFFSFTGVDTGSYVVIITNTGFSERASATLSLTGEQTLETGDLLIAPSVNKLADVTVSTTRRPLLEKVEDKLVFNAESDATLDGQQATDVLRKTPFLSVDNDGNVLMNGQKNFKILLNGKESSMFAKDPKEVLKSFPASLIKKVEVITQPSAKYDAEGIAGIINIITKKKIIGYNASIGIYGNSNHIWNLNSNINAKYGKFGFSSYVGMGGGNNIPGRSENLTTSTGAAAYRERKLFGSSLNSWSWRNINTELSYDIDSLNTISSYFNLYGGSNNNVFDQQSYLITSANDTTKGIFNTINNSQYPSIDWGTDYIRKFSGVENKEFTLRFNGRNGSDDSRNSSSQWQPGFQRFAINNNKSRNNEYTLQADFTLPFKHKQKLELGAKAIFRKAYADYDGLLSYLPDGKFTPDPANSNLFNYYQHVASLYATYGFNMNKVYAKLGVRAERSELGGDFQQGGKIATQSFFNIVPTAYLSKTLKNNQTLTLNYSIRLQRPYIWDLNPFVNNTDSLNIRYGNPNLKPQIIHNLEFGYSMFKGQNNANIKLSAYYSGNQITQYAIFDPATGITAWTSDNIGLNYGSSLSGYVSVKPYSWWTINSNLGLRYDIIVNKLDKHIRNQGPSGWANMNTSLDLNKTIATSFNIGMWKGNVSLQQTQGLNYWYGFGGVLKLKNNKLRLSLRIDNFLNKEMTWKSTRTGPNFSGYQAIYNPGRAIAMSIRWNFGKLTDNVSKKKGVENDDVKK